MTLTYRLSLPGRGDTELRGLPCHPATLPAPHRDPVSVQGAPTSPWQTKQHPGEAGRSGGGSSQPWHFTARVVLPPATSWGEHIQETTADVWPKFNLLASASGGRHCREGGRAEALAQQLGTATGDTTSTPSGGGGQDGVHVCPERSASVPGWRPRRVSLSHSVPQMEPTALCQAA